MEMTTEYEEENSARHCKNEYNGMLSVMNSRDEAIQISSFIKGMSVSIYNVNN